MSVFQSKVMKAMRLLIRAKTALGLPPVIRQCDADELDRLADHVDRALEQCVKSLARDIKERKAAP